MQPFKTLILISFVILLAGCGQNAAVSRNAAPDLTEIEPTPALALTAEAAELDEMTADLLHRSATGAPMPAARPDCGFLQRVARKGARCLSGDADGGLLQRLLPKPSDRMGFAAEAETTEAPESLADMLSEIEGVQRQMARVTDGLSDLMAAQDAEISDLNALLAQGRISRETMNARLSKIRETRAAVASSLKQSGERASTALSALEAAQAAGQPDLEWPILQMETLADEAISTRARIDLL